VLSDQATHKIGIYPPGSTQPSQSISVAGGYAFMLALNKRETALYASIPAQPAVAVYSYPNGNLRKTTFDGVQIPIAVAISPSAPY
jgi:hypothetical protein